MPRKRNIAIIGAGIAGCTAALMLAEAGHKVTLFERSPSVGPVGAGILLQPSGQNVLDQLGLLDAVVERAERIDELIAYTHKHEVLSLLRYADFRDGLHAYGLHRGDLFSVLHDRILGSSINLRLGMTIERDIRGEYDLVIAADGGRSLMRNRFTRALVNHAYGPAALWLVGSSNEVKHRLLQFTHHTNKLVGMLPMGGGRCSFFWGINACDWESLKRSNFTMWREKVINLMPLAKSMLDAVNSFDAFTFARYQAVYLPHVNYGNMVFIGDAAHASGPHLGQGVNLALLDARDLSQSIETTETIADALVKYNRRQRWRNIYYSIATAALMPSFQGNTPLVGLARDLVLPRLQEVAPIRYLMLKTLCGC